MQIIKKILSGDISNSALTNLGLAFLRVFSGIALALQHGIMKFPPSERFIQMTGNLGFPFPSFFAWAAASSEFIGGLLLVVGFLTRPAAFLILVTMYVAAFVRNAGQPFAQQELAVLYGVIVLFFLLAGPGRFSLDAVLYKKIK
jgi:putative oxidoreductase